MELFKLAKSVSMKTAEKGAQLFKAARFIRVKTAQKAVQLFKVARSTDIKTIRKGAQLPLKAARHCSPCFCKASSLPALGPMPTAPTTYLSYGMGEVQGEETAVLPRVFRTPAHNLEHLPKLSRVERIYHDLQIDHLDP